MYSKNSINDYLLVYARKRNREKSRVKLYLFKHVITVTVKKVYNGNSYRYLCWNKQ